MKEIIKRLENEWDKENGFFGQLRDGHFSEIALSRLIKILDEIKEFERQNDSNFINKRVVSLTWYSSIFISWQKERVLSSGITEEQLFKAQSLIENILEDILGVP